MTVGGDAAARRRGMARAAAAPKYRIIHRHGASEPAENRYMKNLLATGAWRYQYHRERSGAGARACIAFRRRTRLQMSDAGAA